MPIRRTTTTTTTTIPILTTPRLPHPHRIKQTGALWFKQLTNALQSSFYLIGSLYFFLDHKNLNESPPPSSIESGISYLLLSFSWLIAAITEEVYHRILPYNFKSPWTLTFFYLILLAHGISVIANNGGIDFRSLSMYNFILVVIQTSVSTYSTFAKPPYFVSSFIPTPEEEASLLSTLTFYWFQPVISKGLRTRVGAEVWY